MKKLLVGLLALGSISTFAGPQGLPSQDPVVKMLRDKFETATQPTIEDLHIGKSWDCKEFHAFRDSFKVSESKSLFVFDTYDGIITNSGTGNIQYMIFDGSSLTGNKTSASHPFFIRVTRDGDLIGENIGTQKRTDAVMSISDSSKTVQSYVICPKSKIH